MLLACIPCNVSPHGPQDVLIARTSSPRKTISSVDPINFWTVVLEKTLESPLDCKDIKPVHPKGNQYWIFIGRTNEEAETLATWCKELIYLKRPWFWERLKAGRERDDRGWDAWMAWLTQWTWVWASSGSWWWTGKPGVLRSMGSQRVRYDWVTERML